MRLKLISKQKAENYDGNSITYELLTNTIEQKRYVLNELLRLKNIEPQKLKIEYLKNDKIEIESQYGMSIKKYDFNQYNNIQFVKYKAFYNKTKISITIDFKDEYIRIKGNYTNSFNDDTIEELVKYITKDL